MPKRSKFDHIDQSESSSCTNPANKRLSLPRGCKRPVKRKKTLAEIFHMSYKRSKQEQKRDESKHVKKQNKIVEKVEVESDDKDDLDVVFDIQEEKKNKVYEVINVASDDETPNQITFERLYADKPEDRLVFNKPIDLDIIKVSKEPKAPSEGIDLFGTSDDFSFDNIVCEIVQETMIKDREIEISMIEGCSNENIPEAQITADSTNDSDDDVVCIDVIDAKAKAEQKKANIIEICLSSDSEGEANAVPPVRLKMPKAMSQTGFYDSYCAESSNFSTESLLPLMFKKNLPYTAQYLNWESSLSPQVRSLLVNDESCSSAVTNSDQHALSSRKRQRPRKYTQRLSSSSSSSSTEDDSSFYWQADRECRWKSSLRYEELTTLGQKYSKGDVTDRENTFTFKVMSYNVLAQQLLMKHRYLYSNHDYRTLAWPRRWNLIYEEIKQEDPDILCLQEVECAQLQLDFVALLHLGYRYVYKKRTNEFEDGVAVYYKEKLFEEDEQSRVEFYQSENTVLDRDNVGVVLRLRLKQSPRNAIVVATTHLLYNPRRGDVKLAQTQVMLAEIDRLAYNMDTLSYYPVIFTGDFNLRPSNGVYELITKGKLNYEGKSRRELQPCTMKDKSLMHRVLLPSSLGITDRCQHANVLDARVRHETTNYTGLYNSENNILQNGLKNISEEISDDRFGSGTLYHDFNFRSVYRHTKKNGQPEATTFHKKWVTVDYIFYSSTPEMKNGKKQKEGSLHLLSSMRMPTVEEYINHVKNIPNFAFGSDHMSLVATFLLKLNCELHSAPSPNDDLAPLPNEDLAPSSTDDLAPLPNDDLAPLPNDDLEKVPNDNLEPLPNDDSNYVEQTSDL